MPTTDLGSLIVSLVAQSCRQGWFALLMHLRTIVGEAEANEALKRVNAEVYAKAVRPSIIATNSFQ